MTMECVRDVALGCAIAIILIPSVLIVSFGLSYWLIPKISELWSKKIKKGGKQNEANG